MGEKALLIMSKIIRPRVCAAIIYEDKILMVRHKRNDRSYWTLPGGGVEEGENHEQAVMREVYEETHLQIKVIRFLFDEPYSNGTTYCYLAKVDGSEDAKLGSDPEEKEIPPRDRILQEVNWHSLESKRYDRQVSKVLECLSRNDNQET